MGTLGDELWWETCVGKDDIETDKIITKGEKPQSKVPGTFQVNLHGLVIKTTDISSTINQLWRKCTMALTCTYRYSHF